MYIWFWYFIIYSVLGFGLEVLYTRTTGSGRTERKCRLLLPVCPVYGAGAALILLLPEAVRARPAVLFVCAAAAATAAEYAAGVIYERAAGVAFWDYAGRRGQLGGKICPRFSAAWGVLGLVLVRWVHPGVRVLAAGIPPEWTPMAGLVYLLDTGVSFVLLRRGGSPGALRWRLPRPGRGWEERRGRRAG